ncbi:aminotransferase class V-fold PLP-dependent enzyme [Galbitalea sp. SE-J8]|uniref:pyridoxal phosphate-dependent decarboxylase family protein n=1 Tax=Galbitalea sp. SE-J8 TaxID=3054952 RepID=UPI00259CCB68|nr:aminotransferase class V-fold PLP-dependent enzyme [Galbitalea sp. SE-J8]MDM4764231.1 aminotransferase class V-fold PLP-dependent enzyme [Galbitalea sp. SE-J8]
MIAFDADAILARLDALRAADAPTHGGRVLSYVYDSGLAELDALAADAMARVQSLNGLDPTTFPSVAVMESEVVGFARSLLGGDGSAGGAVVGSVTTGGTESCLLAVKTARDAWRAGSVERAGIVPRLVAPETAHAAFQKAAHYLGLTLDLVPVSATGAVDAADVIARLDPHVALVVVSAPAYPTATLDPIEAVAAAAAERGIRCHVDACIGGLALPFWSGPADESLPPWDLRVPGVTSISADLHKFGYAPKGVSVLLQRGRDLQRHQYFATTNWPGYPVINPTVLGSKSAGPLAAAWAIVHALGESGFGELMGSTRRSTAALIDLVGGIEGLAVVGAPVGPLFAVAADASVDPSRRVDPHHWADEARALGWSVQQQPAHGAVPRTAHLTITPVTQGVLPVLGGALVAAADAVRGVPPVDAAPLLGGLPALAGVPLLGGLPALAGVPSSEEAWALLGALGLASPDGTADAAGLPPRMAPLLALIEALPDPIVERVLTELLARVVEPR